MKPLDEQFAETLHLVAHAWRTELDRRLRPLGFSHSRWLLLMHLSRHDGCTHCELAQHMGIEAATLVKQVDHMEQEGLLKRCGSETDRRVKHLYLSPDGKKAVEIIRSNAAELRKEILDGSSKEDIGNAITVLQNVRDKLAGEP
ncbi:transcriptional regulator SlyA [mine drainage metagenome]|jgi:MarR family transcriptional regulator, transcriptional regulator for hemolysin|uniref:Transcriptional regulator SlyA n=1 Tax=mine drainage metagenome TaxID=410659 RepID=A0A1J5T5T3_9ZZZZ